jgi:hypothetical protein
MRGHLLPLSGLALLGLTLAACTDFARPEPLSISAEPVIVAPRPEKAEPEAAAAPADGAAPAAPRPAPPARPAAAKSGGG